MKPNSCSRSCSRSCAYCNLVHSRDASGCRFKAVWVFFNVRLSLNKFQCVMMNKIHTQCCREEGHHTILLEELGVVWLLPVQQVLQVVDEGSLPQVTSLSQNWTHRRDHEIIHVKVQNCMESMWTVPCVTVLLYQTLSGLYLCQFEEQKLSETC